MWEILKLRSGQVGNLTLDSIYTYIYTVKMCDHRFCLQLTFFLNVRSYIFYIYGALQNN